MLQAMGLQRVRHDLVTEQQQQLTKCLFHMTVFEVNASEIKS